MKKIIILLLCFLCLTSVMAGCTQASDIAFEKQEYTITEGESLVPVVTVRPKKFGYELYSTNNTILTVDGEKVTALKTGVVTLRAVSGNKEAEATVYVVAKQSVDVLDPTFPDPSYITFSVINYTAAQLESEVIRTLTLPAGTDITSSFPSLIGYDLTWYSDRDGINALPKNVAAPSGQVTYYAVAQARVNRFLTDEKGRVVGLEYPNLEHKTLVFPSSYGDLTLTGVADHAFYGDTTIETIVIPRTFTYIGSFAFAGCTSLTTVRFAEGSLLEEIGAFAFGPTYTEPKQEEEVEEDSSEILDYLSSLLDSVGLSQLVQTPEPETEEEITINEDYCSSLTEMELPSSLKTIGSYAFYNCNSFAAELPEGLETISYGAFRGSKITVADLKNVKKIDAYAFYDCTELSEVLHSEKVEECGGYAFTNTALYSTQIAKKTAVYAGTMVVGCYAGLDRVELLHGTTLIADYAFNTKKQDNLTVIFPEGGNVRIGWQSFYVTGYRTSSDEFPIFSDNLFLAVGENESSSYAAEYPLLADKFCERKIYSVTEKDQVNFGLHSVLKTSSGSYVYDRFIVGTTEGKFYSPYEIDLSLLPFSIVRINSTAFSSIAPLQKIGLGKVETVADFAVSGCPNLAVIDFTQATVVPTLLTSSSFLFSGFSEDCVVEVTKENYNAFKTKWEERTTAKGKLAYRQTISLYLDGDFYQEAEMLLPGSNKLGTENVTWYLDEDFQTPVLTVPVGTTTLYGKTN